ncbi:fucosyltransferase CAZy family GT37-like protein [Selaginella moellendorffii]|uniref:Fucosyltransferase n=1 Tax=Selaginella moellendorffii TaxID=88036 RepID=D8SAZ3_SELML|nr:fucosyltransferase CAZy family GT37-like protein [Selaginella moellendorffii]
MPRVLEAATIVLFLFFLAVVWFQQEKIKFFISRNERSNHSAASDASSSRANFYNLLPAREDHGKCKSRFEQHRYGKRDWEYVPSEYLIDRLRSYEEFHARCTRGNSQTWFNSSTATENNDCKFILWLDNSGLGNKMVSIAATFLYALLTRRVLLIDPAEDMEALFCEPFPRSSWFAPRDVPLEFLRSDEFRISFDKCHPGTAKFARHAYIEIMNGYDSIGDKFFCEKQQQNISDQFPWLTITTNLYFVPSLYYVPSFRTELDKLFPRQEAAVFQHLVKYLFHPSNAAWDRATRFYDTYMAGSSKLVGVQMRVLPNFQDLSRRAQSFSDAMVQCLLQSKLLPDVSVASNSSASGKIIGVVVASLDGQYFDGLREIYVSSPTVDGSLVRVFAPSKERWQQTNDRNHDEKALADMLLLSFCAELVTSPGSTFGYAAQGLGGVKPWLLNEKNCSKLDSTEPCFHAKVFYGCNCDSSSEAKSVQNNARSCPDVPWGLQTSPFQKTGS